MADESKKADEEISDDEIDQIIEDISKEETPAKPAAAPLSLVQGEKMSTKDKEQALTLEMNGVINLKLCFSSGERSIEVLCTEEALLCRMADGTEFRIPTGIQSAKRKSA